MPIDIQSLDVCGLGDRRDGSGGCTGSAEVSLRRRLVFNAAVVAPDRCDARRAAGVQPIGRVGGVLGNRRPGPHVFGRGFTLVEIMVAVVIIGVLSAMMIPSFGAQRDNAQLRTEAERLVAAARYAQLYASGRRTVCRLLVSRTDTQQIAYRLEIPDADSESGFTSLSSTTVRTTTLPQTIGLSAIEVYPGIDAEPARFETEATASGLDGQGQRAVFFYPGGTADSALIRLSNGRREWSLVVEPNTGRVLLHDGRIEQAPNLREDLDAA